jgi:hypothetical protein
MQSQRLSKIRDAWENVVIQDSIVLCVKPRGNGDIGFQNIVKPDNSAMAAHWGCSAPGKRQGNRILAVDREKVRFLIFFDGGILLA